MWQEASYGKKGGKLKRSYLWLNTETDVALAGQEVSVPDSLLTCDFISVYYYPSTVSPGSQSAYRWESGLCRRLEFLSARYNDNTYPNPRPIIFGFQDNSTTTNTYFRYITFVEGGSAGNYKIYISDCWRLGTSTKYNSRCIPAFIYGYTKEDITETG